MKFLDKLFRRPAFSAEEAQTVSEPIVIVPIPALVALFMALEKQKDAPLTENEVIEARDNAACIAMTAKHRDQITESRGYADINPEAAWSEWQIVREMLIKSGEL